MDEGSAFARAQAALRDGFGFDELAEFIVGGLGCDRFVVAEELPLREIMQVEPGFELGEVGQCWALGQQAAGDELRASLLHADFEGGIRFGIERTRLAVFDLVLPHPATMRLANLDLDTGVLFSPFPNESLHFAKTVDVVVVSSVLANFEPAIGVE